MEGPPPGRDRALELPETVDELADVVVVDLAQPREGLRMENAVELGGELLDLLRRCQRPRHPGQTGADDVVTQDLGQLFDEGGGV